MKMVEDGESRMEDRKKMSPSAILDPSQHRVLRGESFSTVIAEVAS
jgi:hypothetical protein